MDIEITTLAERPGLAGRVWELDDDWPEFIGHDPVASALNSVVPTVFPDFTLVATDGDGAVVARGCSVPFALHVPDRGSLPGTGWDEVHVWAFRDRDRGVRPDTVSAVEIAIDVAHRGKGLSAVMLAAMRANAAARGFAELVAPVRPNRKHLEPATPIAEYARRTRADGLPHDPWIRVHVRAGGVIDSIAPASMTAAGSLAQWRAWTGLPFDRPGPVEVPGGLSPVHCDVDRDWAVYVEPNVWIRHSLT